MAEKIYAARKKVEQTPAGAPRESLSEKVDRARNALLVGDISTAQSLLENR